MRRERFELSPELNRVIGFSFAGFNKLHVPGKLVDERIAAGPRGDSHDAGKHVPSLRAIRRS